MLRLRILLSGILLAITTLASQATTVSSYYCATGFRTVKIGDPVEVVRAACGEPTSNQVRQKQITAALNTEVWIYSLTIPTANKNVAYLPVLAITFQEGKVTKIDRGNSSNAAPGYCGVNGTLNLGDTPDSVLSACGRPTTINTSQVPNTTTKTVTEWVYNAGPYKPQMIFDFENGVLSEINSGALGS